MDMVSALIFLLGATMPVSQTEEHRAVNLSVEEKDGTIEVTLTGQSLVDQQIAYELLMEGQSTSRHKGKTSLQANHSAVLSTMKMSASDDWCVSVKVVESEGPSYEYTEGNCV